MENSENTKQLPAFVYGTLMTGFGNYRRCLQGATADTRKAAVSGFRMYDVANGGFPGIVPGNNNVVGQLMYIKPELYEQVMERLDMLEGYREGHKARSMYIRQQVTAVDEAGQEVQCWIYVWNGDVRYCPEVPAGDWRAYKAAIAEVM